MPPRSRSSTLLSISSSHSASSSTSSSHREFVASNPSHLISPAAGVAAFSSSTDLESDSMTGGPKSYKSEHSLRTLKGLRGVGTGKGGGGQEDADGSDEQGSEEEAGDSAITLNHTTSSYAGPGLAGRRTGPQFVIDLPSSSHPETPDESSSSPAFPTRPRSSTFGGIELPPSQQPPPSLSNSNSNNNNTSLPLPSTHPGPRPSLAARGRSTSLSSLSSLRSLDPALHLGGAPLRERRPVLYAGLQAGGILVVSVVGLYLLLRGLLPPIDEEHKKDVKLPKSFDDLKRLNEVLQVYRSRNNLRVLGCYVTVYLFLQAFSVPGSMYLSILGGALWGVLVALPLVCFCVASGALLCYLMSAALGPAVLLHSETWRKRVEAWEGRVMEHKSNLVSYLIILRIAPLPPHWVVNVLAPHLGIVRPRVLHPLPLSVSCFLAILARVAGGKGLWTFWISTFL
ncbi:hypothetical protein JCM11251_003972, partial [Rhodosporidiobolus azoricus]